MSLTAFSQNATVSKLVCFPDTVAKKIAIDLVKGDSAIAVLKETQNLVKHFEDLSIANQRMINTYGKKVEIYQEQIDLYKSKEQHYINIQTVLESDVKKFKRRNTYFKISVGVLTVTTVLGFIIQ
jgi:hypothetical protein